MKITKAKDDDLWRSVAFLGFAALFLVYPLIGPSNQLSLVVVVYDGLPRLDFARVVFKQDVL